jgi:hypothetical protein
VTKHIKEATVTLLLKEFGQRISDVPKNAADAGVDIPVDLNAWLHWLMLLTLAHLLREARGNLNNVDEALCKRVLTHTVPGRALLDELGKLEEVHEVLRADFAVKNSRVMMRFLVEHLEKYDIKTSKVRNATRPDLAASSAELLAALEQNRFNQKKVAEAWRKVSCAEGGEEWTDFSVLMMYYAVKEVFGQSGACSLVRSAAVPDLFFPQSLASPLTTTRACGRRRRTPW